MPTVYFNVPRGFDMLIAALARRRRVAPQLLRRGEVRVLCRRGAAAEPVGRDWKSCRSRPSAGRCRWCRPGAPPRPRRSRPTVISRRALRQHRRADSRHRTETGAVGRQARGARARPERHAGLLEGAGADRAGVRRRRLLSDRRRRDVRRSGSARSSGCSSTAASPRTSSSIPAPGSASAPCASPASRRWRRWRRTSS